MPTWTVYKGLKIPSSSTGDAGINLTANFEALASTPIDLTTTAVIPVVNGGNAINNGAALTSAYSAAAALTPGGDPLSSTNRACLLIFPGTYEFAAELDIQYEHVDLIGVGDADNIVLTNSGSQAYGFRKTANDVTLANLTFDSSTVSGAIFCQDTGSATGSPENEHLESIRFTGSVGSMAQNSGTWEGTYTGCTDLTLGGLFAGSITGGTFTNCSCGGYGFGGPISGGTFINCDGGQFGFASGGGGTISGGSFIGCSDGGLGQSFGYGGTISGGSFINCNAGDSAFDAVITGGIFQGCIAGDGSFGISPSATSTIDGATFIGCKSGDGSFCSGGTIGGVLPPTFLYCSSGTESFGNGGTITSGEFNFCRRGRGQFQRRKRWRLSKFLFDSWKPCIDWGVRFSWIWECYHDKHVAHECYWINTRTGCGNLRVRSALVDSL